LALVARVCAQYARAREAGWLAVSLMVEGCGAGAGARRGGWRWGVGEMGRMAARWRPSDTPVQCRHPRRSIRATKLAYFADVFTPETWSAFVADGGRVTAFGPGSLSRGAGKVRAGDRFVCYLKGKFSFVGALEARSEAFTDEHAIWGRDDFPVRVHVEPFALFSEETALPLMELEGKLSFYAEGLPHSNVPSRFQGSPRALSDTDGFEIWRAVLAREDGVRSLARTAMAESDGTDAVDTPGPGHSEAQALLAEIGLATGCSVWLPRGDRLKVGRIKPALPDQLLAELPFLFAGKAQQVVQNIDVIWLKNASVKAVFEVEHTTSIYSGLLRMSDLVALMPNISFPMFIVSPEARRAAVRDEITRPTFSAHPIPLQRRCGFIASERLAQRLTTLGDDMLRYIQPEFINDLAEYF